MRFPARIAAPLISSLAFFTAALTLSGCGAGLAPTEVATPGVAIHGSIHGGQQPVTGSKIYLYALSTSGYGLFALSQLNGTGFVTSDAGGNFSITGDYTCPAGAYVYLLAKGGNPGLYAGANNPSLAEMAALGPCASLNANTFISLNEVTTVATAYSLAAFMTSDVQASTSSTNLLGMRNAFSSYGLMVNPANGFALSAPPNTTGVVPQAEINTLANILASCVNSDGTTGVCGNLSLLTGNSTDTANAAIYIAQHPATNVAGLYGQMAATAPFQPSLTAAPNDWSVAVQIDGGAFNGASVLAIDASGNAWVGNTNLPGLVEVGPDGTLLSGTAGYQAPGFTGPYYVTIDPTGNVWTDLFATGSSNRNYFLKFSSAGTLLSPTGISNACSTANTIDAITSDLAGNIWFTRPLTICSMNTNGVLLSPTNGWTGTISTSTQSSRGLAVDSGGNIWHSGMLNAGSTGTLANFSSAGTAISPAAGYTASGYYWGFRLAIDSSNTAWVPNYETYTSSTGTVSTGSTYSFNSAGTATSPTGGYPLPTVPSGFIGYTSASFVDGTNRIWNGESIVNSNTGAASGGQIYALTSTGATAVAPLVVPGPVYGGGFDASGNLWIASFSYIVKVIGVGSPTITPLSQAALQNKIGTRP